MTFSDHLGFPFQPGAAPQEEQIIDLTDTAQTEDQPKQTRTRTKKSVSSDA